MARVGTTSNSDRQDYFQILCCGRDIVVIIIPQIVVVEDEGREVSVLQAANKEEIPVEMKPEDFQKVLEENENPIAFDETPSNADSGNELDYYLKYFFINGNLKRKENYNFNCRTLLCFIIFNIVYSIFQSKFFRKKIINNVIYF